MNWGCGESVVSVSEQCPECGHRYLSGNHRATTIDGRAAVVDVCPDCGVDLSDAYIPDDWRNSGGDKPRVATDGGVAPFPEVYPVSVRVEVAEQEVTWHTSDTAYEQLHNHPDGNLVAEIEADAKARDGSLFDAVVAESGSYRMTTVDSEGSA